MASKGVNKVLIIGHLGSNPELRYTQNNTAIANISVATTEQWRDKSSGEDKSVTEWHRCVAYKRLAEIAGEYLKKGSKVYIEGRLQTRKWQGQDGIDRYITEIIISELQMLDSKPQGQQDYRGHTGSNQSNPTYEEQGQLPPSRPDSSFNPDDDFDSDVPF